MIIVINRHFFMQRYYGCQILSSEAILTDQEVVVERNPLLIHSETAEG